MPEPLWTAAEDHCILDVSLSEDETAPGTNRGADLQSVSDTPGQGSPSKGSSKSNRQTGSGQL